METIEYIHKLSNEEVITLEQLIGKSLINIYASSVSMNSVKPIYEFSSAINLKFKDESGFVVFSAKYEETPNFYQDFVQIFIEKDIKPLGIKTSKEGALIHPLVNLSVGTKFIVKKVEILGETCIEKSVNPKKPLIEKMETENTIVFYSEDRRLIIRPYGAVPWIRIGFDNEFIEDDFILKDVVTQSRLKLKKVLE